MAIEMDLEQQERELEALKEILLEAGEVSLPVPGNIALPSQVYILPLQRFVNIEDLQGLATPTDATGRRRLTATYEYPDPKNEGQTKTYKVSQFIKSIEPRSVGVAKRKTISKKRKEPVVVAVEDDVAKAKKMRTDIRKKQRELKKLIKQMAAASKEASSDSD